MAHGPADSWGAGTLTTGAGACRLLHGVALVSTVSCVRLRSGLLPFFSFPSLARPAVIAEGKAWNSRALEQHCGASGPVPKGPNTAPLRVIRASRTSRRADASCISVVRGPWHRTSLHRRLPVADDSHFELMMPVHDTGGPRFHSR